MRLPRHALATAAALLCGCAGLQHSMTVRGGRPDPRPLTGPTAIANGREPGREAGDELPRPEASGTTLPTAAAERRVCRRSAWPRGYIAVAYVAGAQDCPAAKTRDDDYPVAILVAYTGRGVGAALDVCADQHVPGGWSVDTEAGGTEQCPGAARTGRDGGATTKRIRRIR